MSPSLANRAISPLAFLKDGDNGGGETESRSYLPKMTSVGAMFPRSQPEGAGGNHWKRPSMDTIGRIFGSYANTRDTAAPTSVRQGDGETDIGTIQGRENWEEMVRHRESRSFPGRLGIKIADHVQLGYLMRSDLIIIRWAR